MNIKDNSESNSENRTIGISSERHAAELESLYAISRLLVTNMPQQQMFEETLDTLDKVLGMKRGTVMLLSPDGAELIFEAARDVSQARGRRVKFSTGEGITGQVLATNKPAIIPNVSKEPKFLGRLHDRDNHLIQDTSFICVPISVGTEVVGTLSTDRECGSELELNDDLRVLSIVACIIAGSVKTRRDAETQKQALEAENMRLQDELEDRFRPENMVGTSGAMRDVYQAIHQVSASDTTVLIRGESGTGKELVASAVHYTSPRAKGPFIRVNCAALSEELLTSELFGHEKGAFTGAVQARKGRIEEAEGGTLFLDEIGDFSPSVQVKLLRVLQEGEYERVGSNQVIKSKARIVCATHRDLESLLDNNEFRQDLYYRINIFPIHLPPLRQRKDDILLLADFFVERYSKLMKKDVGRISTPAINMMVAYHWPGNVRELENCIERAVLLCTDGVLRGHHLPPTLQTSDDFDSSKINNLTERVELFERDIIVDTLKRNNGNMAASARDLDITARILRYKIKQLGIEPDLYNRK